MTTTYDQRIQQATTLARSGNTAQARRLLLPILKEEPTNAAAWRAIIETAANPTETKHYLEHMLEHLPGDEWAKRALEGLKTDVGRYRTLEGAYVLSRGERLRAGLAANWRQLQANAAIFFRNPLAVLGLVLIAGFGVMALLHPILLGSVWPVNIYHPVTGFASNVAGLHPVGPSEGHLLGTDPLGRDVLSMLMAGARPTWTIAITAGLATGVIGTVLACLTAYYGRGVDLVLTHISKAFLLMPATLIMVVIGARFQFITAWQFGLLYGLVAGFGATTLILRSHALSVLQRPFIEAARVAGAGPLRIIFTHLIPHVLPLAAVNVMLAVTGVVVADGFIWFLGLRNVRTNWGAMIYNAITYGDALRAVGSSGVAWNALVAPAMALSLFALAFYLVARGLQDVADPQTRIR